MAAVKAAAEHDPRAELVELQGYGGKRWGGEAGNGTGKPISDP